MFKAGVGISNTPVAKEAACEAAIEAMENGELSSADWALIFCTFPHRENYKDILRSVCGIIKTRNLSGCSGIGVLTNSAEIEAEPGVCVLAVSSNSIKTYSFICGEPTDGGFNTGVEIGKRLKPIGDEKALLTLLPDPFNFHPELLFRGLESELGYIPIVGATASENPYINETTVFNGDNVSQRSVSGIMMRGDFNYIIGITQGCQPVGDPFVITKSENNIIIELDNKPAYEVLKMHVPQIILENPNNLIRMLFVGFIPDLEKREITGRDYLIRNLIGINPQRGIIGVAENVRNGQNITFAIRNPEMAREDLKQMLERIKSSTHPEKPFKFGLYFNCCARGSSLYGQKGIDTAYISHYLEGVPIVGFFGNSEFANLHGKNHLFTYTGVLVLISE
ncbi:MAG: FIST C-terminal domain-containing protein [Deltaproteobacteria bacterium]|nr:FIST C-terminal domain-containing protein [Deltaproteobacteria bacterium]